VLIEPLHGRIDQRHIGNARDLAEHNEGPIGLEILVENLRDEDVRISRDERVRFEALARRVDMPVETYEFLHTLEGLADDDPAPG
jgi:hypothetical protein